MIRKENKSQSWKKTKTKINWTIFRGEKRVKKMVLSTIKSEIPELNESLKFIIHNLVAQNTDDMYGLPNTETIPYYLLPRPVLLVRFFLHVN